MAGALAFIIEETNMQTQQNADVIRERQELYRRRRDEDVRNEAIALAAACEGAAHDLEPPVERAVLATARAVLYEAAEALRAYADRLDRGL